MISNIHFNLMRTAFELNGKYRIGLITKMKIKIIGFINSICGLLSILPYDNHFLTFIHTILQN